MVGRGLGWQKVGIELGLVTSIPTIPTIPTPWGCSKLLPNLDIFDIVDIFYIKININDKIDIIKTLEV